MRSTTEIEARGLVFRGFARATGLGDDNSEDKIAKTAVHDGSFERFTREPQLYANPDTRSIDTVSRDIYILPTSKYRCLYD